jgi:hypothetical protein
VFNGATERHRCLFSLSSLSSTISSLSPPSSLLLLLLVLCNFSCDSLSSAVMRFSFLRRDARGSSAGNRRALGPASLGGGVDGGGGGGGGGGGSLRSLCSDRSFASGLGGVALDVAAQVACGKTAKFVTGFSRWEFGHLKKQSL